MKKFVISGFLTETKFMLTRISVLIWINLLYLTVGFSQVDETYICKHHHKSILRVPANFERSLSLAAQNADFLFHECKWQIDPAVRYISGSVFTKFKAFIRYESSFL